MKLHLQRKNLINEDLKNKMSKFEEELKEKDIELEVVTKKFTEQLQKAQAAVQIAQAPVPTPPVPTTTPEDRQQVLLREPQVRPVTTHASSASSIPQPRPHSARLPERSVADLSEGPLQILEECITAFSAPSTIFLALLHTSFSIFYVPLLIQIYSTSKIDSARPSVSAPRELPRPLPPSHLASIPQHSDSDAIPSVSDSMQDSNLLSDVERETIQQTMSILNLSEREIDDLIANDL
jgi:hypothetical protein